MRNNIIISCPQCGAKNRIPSEKAEVTAKCGRCRQPMPALEETSSEESLTLRCGQCRTKNRVPVAKLNAGAKCGRCGARLPDQDILSGRTVMVTDANFPQTVLQSPLPVVLYCWAPWCSVCSGTGPQVDQLAAEAKGKLRVAKMNIDANPRLAGQYNVMSVPSFLIFDDGRLKEHLPGAVSKHDLMMKMAAYV